MAHFETKGEKFSLTFGQVLTLIDYSVCPVEKETLHQAAESMKEIEDNSVSSIPRQMHIRFTPQHT